MEKPIKVQEKGRDENTPGNYPTMEHDGGKKAQDDDIHKMILI